MRVLVINCGSSTLKFQLVEHDERRTGIKSDKRLAWGTVDRIGGRARVSFRSAGGSELEQQARIPDHESATYRVFRWLRSQGSAIVPEIEAVGHRVVHGGGSFQAPTLIDNRVLHSVEVHSHSAPLHNRPALGAIASAREQLGPKIPQVAVFDTAFHSTMPAHATTYALPLELAEKHRIRRYGFHGLAHRYMVERYSEIMGIATGETTIVTLQLGNGCSATAVRNGVSVDTSMGLTPLEGLMMGTRSGDLDPSIPHILARREGADVGDIVEVLNARSGLLGVSGRSGDVRQLLKAMRRGNERAMLAVEMFCYRVRKYVGAYLAALGGAEAIVFGGGIGENSPEVRERICTGMDWFGLYLDESLNAKALDTEARISGKESRLHAYVIPVDEGAIIARDTVHCLKSQPER
jgi:acetate kinase